MEVDFGVRAFQFQAGLGAGQGIERAQAVFGFRFGVQLGGQ